MTREFETFKSLISMDAVYASENQHKVARKPGVGMVGMEWAEWVKCEPLPPSTFSLAQASRLLVKTPSF